jgi:hypothetical protein
MQQSAPPPIPFASLPPVGPEYGRIDELIARAFRSRVAAIASGDQRTAERQIEALCLLTRRRDRLRDRRPPAERHA